MSAEESAVCIPSLRTEEERGETKIFMEGFVANLSQLLVKFCFLQLDLKLKTQNQMVFSKVPIRSRKSRGSAIRSVQIQIFVINASTNIITIYTQIWGANVIG